MFIIQGIHMTILIKFILYISYIVSKIFPPQLPPCPT
jgi:hypothetical protein